VAQNQRKKELGDNCGVALAWKRALKITDLNPFGYESGRPTKIVESTIFHFSCSLSTLQIELIPIWELTTKRIICT